MMSIRVDLFKFTNSIKGQSQDLNTGLLDFIP